ncbi:zinc metallopeptidase [Vagococcus intermedius]|uniref:Zinc metallopeptidase n=1 Tax=Vagococcus intermedius TaxID=2991418 RepID=A0AAF0CTV5_9ENTE|nr:zinc metallopeptidase [Vagococcus intermedius]WEG72875.1 zinc metallopeptidase [Vagococcus intermedius]WEG74962.1 zinc metallopeptidase [Vagococcus intermedius]
MYGAMNLIWDKTYIFILIGMLLSFLASNYVTSTFKKYSGIRNKRGYTGIDAAQMVLKVSNVQGVSVRAISGQLTDNYNSGNKVLSLSEPVANVQSVAAVGVAAHECGHAVQDAVDYVPLRLRAALVPIANFGSSISFPLIMAGVFFGQFLINIGILCFSVAFLFQIVTLPVEFNASRRALNILEETEMLDEEEMTMAKHVLFAAALTYVASAVSVLLQLLRLVILFGDRRD